MSYEPLKNLSGAIISKKAILDGLLDHAERINNQLERTLQQIDELNNELAALDELQAESSNDPETQGPPHKTLFSKPIDLEPANHPEDT